MSACSRARRSRGRTVDRARRLDARCEWDRPGGDRRGRSVGGAARSAIRTPGVAGPGREHPRELGALGLAGDDRAGVAQPLDCNRVASRAVPSVDRRAVPGGQLSRVEVVLDPDRHAEQRELSRRSLPSRSRAAASASTASASIAAHACSSSSPTASRKAAATCAQVSSLRRRRSRSATASMPPSSSSLRSRVDIRLSVSGPGAEPLTAAAISSAVSQRQRRKHGIPAARSLWIADLKADSGDDDVWRSGRLRQRRQH